MRDLVKEAISELTDNALHSQGDTTVTAAEALEHVDEPLATKWLAAHLPLPLNFQARDMLLEIVEKQIDEDSARNLFASVLNSLSANGLADGAAAQVGRQVAEAVRHHIAEDLAFEAQRFVRDYEPSDSEMSRDFHPHVPDDPVSRDRSTLARNVNGSNRVARMR